MRAQMNFVGMCVYASCEGVCAQMFMKICVVVHYYLMTKFHNDSSIRRGDICKMVPTFKDDRFLFYFPYFYSCTPQKSFNMEDY